MMSKNCEIGYEVSVLIKTFNKTRTAVFTSRTDAQAFKRKWPGATLQVVELCNGKIKRRGKRMFSGRRARRR